jgi:hypothetical protein
MASSSVECCVLSPPPASPAPEIPLLSLHRDTVRRRKLENWISGLRCLPPRQSIVVDLIWKDSARHFAEPHLTQKTSRCIIDAYAISSSWREIRPCSRQTCNLSGSISPATINSPSIYPSVTGCRVIGNHNLPGGSTDLRYSLHHDQLCLSK